MARLRIELPLSTRWLLAVAFFACLGLVAFLVVRGNDSTAPTSNARGTLEANQIGQIVVNQDQAPHTAPLRGPASPRAALARAIAADVRARIASHDLTGPFGSVACSADREPHAGRDPFVCTVTAASLTYTFYGVADRRARRLVWCKEDAVAEAGLTVPLSPRCLS